MLLQTTMLNDEGEEVIVWVNTDNIDYVNDDPVNPGETCTVIWASGRQLTLNVNGDTLMEGNPAANQPVPEPASNTSTDVSKSKSS
jgi:hypothetical protein